MLEAPTPYFASDAHWVNLSLVNQPGVLAGVLRVVQHHHANVEDAQVYRLDDFSSTAILKISLAADVLDRIEVKLSKLIGVRSVEIVTSRVSA